MRPATSSAFRASPRPRWSRAASPPATPSASPCRRRRRPSPMASTPCRKFRRSGQSEEQVKTSGVAYECGVARFRETSRGHIMGVNSGFLKLIFALDTRRLLGAHIVGEGRDRTDPYRPGGDQSRRHGRFLRQQHLQLPDAGRSLQDRRARRLEPDGRDLAPNQFCLCCTMAQANWISAVPLFQRALRSQAELAVLENSRL